MKLRFAIALTCVTSLSLQVTNSVSQERQILLPDTPVVSPDGRHVAFAHGGDIWAAPIKGGLATRLTLNDATDSQPRYSPDGKRLAFVSTRRGASHAYVMSLEDGSPRQIGFHSEGYNLHQWLPDGRGLLASGRRDHHWRHANRFFPLHTGEESAEVPLFDAYGEDGSLSRDGRHLLFVREGERWWRQGYRGSRAAQIWRYDLQEKTFTSMVDLDYGCRWPLWRPDGAGFYYVGGDVDGFDLWAQAVHPKTKELRGEPRKIADMNHGSITFPSLNRAGNVMVFRHLGDLYRINPASKAPAPERIPLAMRGDQQRDGVLRRNISAATELEFTEDALEIAFIAGGDVWVMDTVLREPIQITDGPGFESNLVFDKDHKNLYVVRVLDGRSDIWRITRGDEKKHWWQNTDFEFTQITDDPLVETYLRLSVDGKNLFYVRGRGELWTRPVDGSGAPKLLVDGFDRPDFDVSHDGKWVAYSQSDDDFNRDVWIVPANGSKPAFNVSRHPDDDFNPRWSPDGRLLAFAGKRYSDSETDIHYVYLQQEEEHITNRERKLESAIARMSSRGGNSSSKSPKRDIEFKGLYDRIHQIIIPNVTESSLRWSPDSKRLAFRATIKGATGIYSVSPPTGTSPTTVTTTDGTIVGWTTTGTLLMSVDGVPTSITSKGAKTTYSFTVRQQLSQSARYAAAFDKCWQTMRDHWYDKRLGNRNWDEVYRRYRPLAEAASDSSTLRTAIELMLGELNGSHLGFYPARESAPSEGWNDVTPHLGIRFDPAFKGPGLKVRDVITNGPADRKGQPLSGDIIRSIDGEPVDPGIDLAKRLSGQLERDIVLAIEPSKKPTLPKPSVKEPLPPWEGTEPELNPRRVLTVRPTTYSNVRDQLYEMWTADNRKAVEQQSEGKLGYLHIRAMNMSSFTEFERQLYYVGYGKDGLVIDVRENGGGSTTDLLLTALTQPQHAVTVPRGGGPGYPQSRMVYATWNKPIVVMCNQNSYSNAEIFSHAIKGLGRGRLVGVPTAGGVISTGAVQIMDVGTLRFPFRGWFVKSTGEDMELNGAVPHKIIWPAPGELPRGVDRQLDKAVQVLREDVEKWSKRPQPTLRRATDR